MTNSEEQSETVYGKNHHTHWHLKQTHVHKLGTDFHSLVKHLAYEVPNICRIRVCLTDEYFEKVQRIPRVTLDVRSEGLNGWTSNRDIINRHNSVSRKRHKVECIRRQGK